MARTKITRTIDDVPCIPEDLTTEILAELPGKSLLRFKCVCKNWLARTSDQYFIAKHYNRSSNKERLLLRMLDPGTGANTFALFTDETFSDYQEPENLRLPNVVTHLLGPFNGIFFAVYGNRHLALLNPATKQLKWIPEPEFKAPFPVYRDGYAFATDPASSCCGFKVVLFRHFVYVPAYTDRPPNLDLDSDDDENHPYYPLQIGIYTSRTNSWTYSVDPGLMNAEWHVIPSLCDTCVDGVYYWITCYKTDDAFAGILALDMKTERFNHDHIPVPELGRWFYLAVCFDSIALLSYKTAWGIDLWLMKDGCWSKKFNIRPRHDEFDVKKPVGVWKKDGVIFLDRKKRLIWYNLVTKEFKILGSKKTRDSFSSVGPSAFAYRESLVQL